MQINDNIPLINLIILFVCTLIVGSLLVLPIYRFDYKHFKKSKLFIKMFFWIPIFLVFLAVLYSSNLDRTIFLALLMVLSFLEFRLKQRRAENKVILRIFFALFVIGLAHFFLLGLFYNKYIVNLLITLCFASVLSDVFAFLIGKSIGTHNLPEWINNSKTWEGVVGQIIGSLFGVMLVNYFVTPVASFWIFLPIGIGCAVGDLANSFAKKDAHIKYWSKAIPQHGGFIDRLSSIAFSAFFVFYFLVLTRLL